jgi:Fur family ferric uptake transcriptional regulator
MCEGLDVAQAPGTPAPVFSSSEEAFAVLRANGLRVSAARRILLEGLLAVDRLVTAEEIADGLEGRVPICDVTVVYRNLETLEALGLIRHVHLGHGPGRYAIAAGGEREYLVCECCGAVRDVSPDDIEPVRKEIRERFGYTARFTHFPISGLCDACAPADDVVDG